MRPKRVALYLRVSTLDQSSDLQRDELTRFVEARGWETYQVYEDAATGTTANRPMLKALLRDARARKFDVLACWKLDRLFRSLKDLLVTLQELSELGIEFVSLKDQIDMSTGAGRLLVHIIGAFAEFEASIIKQRVIAGLEAARKRGKRLGRPPKVDSSAIRELRKQGLTYRQIMKALSVSMGSVQSALSEKSKS